MVLLSLLMDVRVLLTPPGGVFDILHTDVLSVQCLVLFLATTHRIWREPSFGSYQDVLHEAISASVFAGWEE